MALPKKSGAKSRKIPVPDYRNELLECEKKSWGFHQLLVPEMLKGEKGWTDFNDPQLGKVKACIESVRWVERGIEKDPKSGLLRECVRPLRVSPSKLLECESVARARLPHKLREVDWFSMGMDQPGASGRVGVYLPNPPGPYTKQMYLQQRWEMMMKCFEARNHDPILHGAISTLTAFVFGEGIDIKSPDPAAQAIWDEFEDRTEFQRRLPTWSDMLTTDGNLFLQKIPMVGQPGKLDLVSLDSGTIWEIITDPEDLRKKYAFWQQFSSPYLIQSIDGVPYVKYIINLIPAQDVMHIKINCQEHEKFGRSDLMTALSTSMMIRDLMKFRAIRAMVESKLCVDHIIDGDESDIARHANASGVDLSCPEPLETWHSKAEEIKFHQWQGSGTPKSGLFDEMVSLEAQSVGLPKEYLGGGDQASRAAALTSTQPSAKLIRRRQTEFEFAFMDLYMNVIQEAKRYGLLSPDVSEDVEITFPEIISENKKERIDCALACAAAGVFSGELAGTICAKEMNVTTYDYDEQVQKSQAEQTKKAATDPMLNQIYQRPGQPELPLPNGTSPTKPTPTGTGKQDSYNRDQAGMSNQTRRDLSTSLSAKESISGTTMGVLQRPKEVKRFTWSNARKEALMMHKSGFKLAEGDEESSPPGWKGTVDKMQDHPELDNPFALSWWMDAQGYIPHN